MFKCSGNCAVCGKCKKISQENILSDVSFPDSFEIEKGEGFGIAFDIGTTTIAGTLWDLSKGILLSKKGCHNPQREYGSDIISRITYAAKGEDEYMDLHLPLRKTVFEMIVSMSEEAGVDTADLKRAVFCGNTAMSLFFAGEDVSGLASYPFEPEKLKAMEVESIFGLSHVKGYVICGAGGQIGGDIVAGLLTMKDHLSQDTFKPKKNILFIDIGTNGEIMLLQKDGNIYGCSAAAGPAFEGSCISCGMAAAKGAISKVNVISNGVSFETVGEDASAEGLCGSGLISAIRSLYENRIISQDGTLSNFDYYRRINPFSSLEDFFKEDSFLIQRGSDELKEIYLSQKDIREFQLAKAAIMSGIKILLKEVGIGIHNIDMVYLSGGFSAHTPVSDILKLAVIPEIEKEKIHLAGNTALSGVCMALLNSSLLDVSSCLGKNAIHMELSQIEGFQEVFLDSFNFNH